MQHKILNQLGLSAILVLAPTLSFAVSSGTIQSVSSYVYTVEPDDDGQNAEWTIYVGQASNSTVTCTEDGINPCSNCDKVDFSNTSTTHVCTSNGIYSTLPFEVTFVGKKTETYTANTKIKAFVGTSPITNLIDQPTFTAGSIQSVTAKMPWSSILSDLTQSSAGTTLTVGLAADGSASSPDDLDESVTIIINYRYVQSSPLQKQGCDSSVSMYSGFCQYNVYPGDEKIYIVNAAGFTINNPNLLVQNLNAATPPTSASADTSGMKTAAIRVFYKEAGDFTTFKGSEWASKDFPIVGDTIKNASISGLTNGVSYSVLAANVDQAGNVSYFFDPALLDNTDPFNDNSKLGLTHAATPQPVTGLLDNKNCFIATAAYGSGDATDVETLRKFRNQYLLNWEGGKNFVRFYYKHSPPIAEFIAEREWLKWIVRESLKPVVLVAALAFKFGFIGLILLFGAAFTVFVGGLTLISRRRIA